MAEAARKLPPLMTSAEFLAWPGDGTDTMYELAEGEPHAMAPASTAHGIIQANLIISLGSHVRAMRPGCQVVTTPGIQPRIRADWNHRIPDLGVSSARNEIPGAIFPSTPRCPASQKS
jgi:Uma2 family endonuclease